MDIFSTHVLNRTVDYLHRPASFLLDTFFTSIQTESSENIHFDIDQSKPRIAPFVSPLIEGRVVPGDGFTTRSFKPAYVKDKRRFNPNAPLKRQLGETIGGHLTPMNRREVAISRSLISQLENLTRSEEVMAAEALRTGKLVITGEDYPTQVIDFQRDDSLTQALTGASRWGETGVKLLDDLEDWAADIQTQSGAIARTVVMDPMAWRLFKVNDKVERLLDIRRGSQADIRIDPMVRGQGEDKARYTGSIGDFDFWVYNDSYLDEAAELHHLLPPYTVLLVSREQLEGTRCYGAIHDEKANYRADRYFTKSWLEEDPAVRWLLMQSAPLMVPYRPNATFCATVR